MEFTGNRPLSPVPARFRLRPCPPCVSAGFCFLSAPEGRLGGLRLGTQGLREITRPLQRFKAAHHLQGIFEMTTVNKSEKDRVVIFDTTLRDGEQCPGATMTFEEKLEVAEMLDDMGVDIIEAGFPITSEGDFQAVSEIARRSKNAVIAGLSRAHPKDIDRCAEAVKFARRGRVHTVIATSPLHMRVKLNMTPEQVIETSIANLTHARTHIHHL